LYHLTSAEWAQMRYVITIFTRPARCNSDWAHVPEGRATIAQRFIAGEQRAMSRFSPRVPEGRLKRCGSAFPMGLTIITPSVSERCPIGA
jgi:hypothetical protein